MYLDVMAEVEIVAVDKHSETSDSSTVSRSSKGVKQATFYCWKYRHYFEVVDKGDKNLKTHCTLCSPSAKPLSCARNMTSSFKKHLDSVHKTVNLVAIFPESTKRKRPEGDNRDNMFKMQATLDRRGVLSVEVQKLLT